MKDMGETPVVNEWEGQLDLVGVEEAEREEEEE
jgi:hypothetical protein